MTSSTQKVLVSGASGYLGGHVVNTLLGEGYNVRALARGSKAAALQKAYAEFGSRFEVFEISDISNDQFPDAFKGIDALIHTASPISGTAESLFKSAVDGSLNILKQAEKAGIKKVVVTGSIVSVYNDRNSFTSKDWNPITKEDALAPGSPPILAYVASKTLAEHAVWDWADAHPHVEVTTINPPYLFGAITPQLQSFIPKPDHSAISTNIIIYGILFPSGRLPTEDSVVYADVQDIAKLHVKAIGASAKPTKEVGQKRFIVASPGVIDWNAAVETIGRERPELKDRLFKGKTASPHPFPTFEYERLEEILGFKKEEFTSSDQTLLNAVDSLVALESSWKKNGHEIPVAPPFSAGLL